jgi:lysophospholipase
MVKFLLEHGANVHVRDRHDRTALLNAIDFGQVESVRLLIKTGANLIGSSTVLPLIGEDLCRSVFHPVVSFITF